MAQHELQYTLESYVEAKNRRDVEGVLKCCHDECYYETKALGQRIEGKPALRYLYNALFTWLPDYQATFEGQVFEGDTMATWGTFGGTLKGEFLGIKPTGRRVELPVVFVVTFKNNLIASDVGYFDLAALCSQGGLSLGEVTAVSGVLQEAA